MLYGALNIFPYSRISLPAGSLGVKFHCITVNALCKISFLLRLWLLELLLLSFFMFLLI